MLRERSLPHCERSFDSVHLLQPEKLDPTPRNQAYRHPAATPGVLPYRGP